MEEETNLPSISTSSPPFPRVCPIIADIKRGCGQGQGNGVLQTDLNDSNENSSCTYKYRNDINKPLLELHKATSHEHPDLVDGGRRFVYRWLLGDGVETIIGMLTPNLHEALSAGKLPRGSIVCLTDWELMRSVRKRKRKLKNEQDEDENEGQEQGSGGSGIQTNEGGGPMGSNNSTTSDNTSELVPFLKIKRFEIVEIGASSWQSSSTMSIRSFHASSQSSEGYRIKTQELVEDQLRAEQTTLRMNSKTPGGLDSPWQHRGENGGYSTPTELKTPKKSSLKTPVKTNQQSQTMTDKSMQKPYRLPPPPPPVLVRTNSEAITDLTSVSSVPPPSGKKPSVRFDVGTPQTQQTQQFGRGGSQFVTPRSGPLFSSAAAVHRDSTAVHRDRTRFKISENKLAEAPTPEKKMVSQKPKSVWNQLNFCKLADLPSRDHGTKVDILAIVDSISPNTVVRNTIGIKRDCRLTDLSTHKLVILSVWVGAKSFFPAPGTLIAFRGLTVHQYDGRSLNAFSDVSGSMWYLENPMEIDGAEELKERYEDELIRKVMAQEEENAKMGRAKHEGV